MPFGAGRFRPAGWLPLFSDRRPRSVGGKFLRVAGNDTVGINVPQAAEKPPSFFAGAVGGAAVPEKLRLLLTDGEVVKAAALDFAAVNLFEQYFQAGEVAREGAFAGRLPAGGRVGYDWRQRNG